MDMLHDSEYEAYVIEDYKMVKGILRANKDALCFINIDSQLTFKQWFNYIHSFSEDEILKSVFIGVLSAKASSSDSKMFLMNLSLPGGFTFLTPDVDSVFHNIQGILDINGAKGQRKYIRLDCSDLNNVMGYLAHEGKLFDLNINNISSVGFVCSYSDSVQNIFQPNTQFNNVSITLNRKSIIAPSVVLKTRDNNAIMLFINGKMSRDDKFAIKNFISTELAKRFEAHIDDTKVDNTHYSQEIDPGLLTNNFANFEGDTVAETLEEIRTDDYIPEEPSQMDSEQL